MIHQFGLATASGSDGSPRPLDAEAWRNGLLSVILILTCSNMGARVLTFRRRTWYERLQLFVLGLALAIGRHYSSTMCQFIPMTSAFDLKASVATSICVCGEMCLFFSIRALVAGLCWLTDIGRLPLTITLSDCLMNFIEGLAICASFIVSVHFGICTSVAILLLNMRNFAITGMSIKNFTSACFYYLGVASGIMGISCCQIFALTGGVFLHLALARMSPEMNEVSEEGEEAEDVWGLILTDIIQNACLLAGIAFMLFLTTYSGQLMG